jgi:hypothetical protein
MLSLNKKYTHIPQKKFALERFQNVSRALGLNFEKIKGNSFFQRSWYHQDYIIDHFLEYTKLVTCMEKITFSNILRQPKSGWKTI